MDQSGRRAPSPVTLPDVVVAGAALAIAAAAWASTIQQMSGMGAGRWSFPTDPRLYAGTWIAMTAAMMLPSIAPTLVGFERLVRVRSGLRAAMAASTAFAGGYAVVWAVAGVVPFVVLAASGALDGGLLMGPAGRYLAAGVLAAAAAYQLVPAKRACLSRLSAPIPHGGLTGALRTGVESGGWCLGCSWALMASLFALGLMSLTWMVVIWALVMVERLLPQRGRLVTPAVGVVLAALAIGVLAVG